MDLIFFGMQGSGKGTQSQMIAKDRSLQIFETGAELRKLAKEDSELARKVKSIMESGNLVPTEVVMEIIADFMHKLPEGQAVLFDGIPRSTDQQELFDELLTKENREFKGVLIEITEDEAVRRLTTRRICEGCKTAFPVFYDKDACEECGGKLVTRKDDTPDAIQTRLDTFREKTIPVIESYKARGKMLIVDGVQGIEEVYNDIIAAL